jgi:hypothetical protein
MPLLRDLLCHREYRFGVVGIPGPWNLKLQLEMTAGERQLYRVARGGRILTREIIRWPAYRVKPARQPAEQAHTSSSRDTGS